MGIVTKIVRRDQHIHKLKERMSPAYSIENFLSTQELNELYSLWNSKQECAITKNTGPITVNLKDISDSDIIKCVIKKYKNKLVMNVDVGAANFSILMFLT